MTWCPSCGGIIGRECFNPDECALIAEQMQQDAERAAYEERFAEYERTLEEERFAELGDADRVG
jgi:hypothetical protein